jgi:hypothetical protein
MHRRAAGVVVLFLASLGSLGLAGVAAAAPQGPLTCHKEVCAVAGPCQTRVSETCEHGGGPPRCPAILNRPDGTACNDGNVCTTADVCTAGVCGGTAVTCTSSTDTCEPSSACATTCDAGGCVVSSSGGDGTLTVPAGALASSVRVNMVFQGSDPSDASVFQVYQFGPNGTTFATPATVDLPAPPLAANQTAVIEVSDGGGSWSEVSTTLSSGRVSGPIAHFSFCRTRAITSQGANPDKLYVLDMVSYQDVASVYHPNGLVIPPVGELGSCYSGDLFGLCFKMKNDTGATITSDCPVPTPDPPPPGCLQVHVAPWQCYTAYRDYPAPFDPSNPDAFEGQHCDSSGLLIPCPESVYNLDTLLPQATTANGGLPNNTTIWVDLSFYANAPQPANGVYPYSCFGSSFIGVDVLFKEPTSQLPLTGMRSAKDGVFIEVPAGQYGCNPVPPATTCKRTWEQLTFPQPANYPMLRFNQAGAAIRRWLLDARF